MNNAKLIINCLYLENYSDNPTTKPYWKAKGNHTFIMEVNSDEWLYGETEVMEFINHQIALSHNNEICKYIPNSVEIEFSEPTQLEPMDMAQLLRMRESNTVSKNIVPTRPQLSPAAQNHFVNQWSNYRTNLIKDELVSYQREEALQNEYNNY